MMTEYLFYNDGNNLILEGDFGYINFNNVTYFSSEILLFSPSLHTIANRRMPLEMQVVHNDNFGNKLMISILFRFSEKDYSLVLGKLGFDKPELKSQEPFKTKTIKEDFDLSKYVTGDKDFFYYDASEATPPCSNKATYLILTDVLKVSKTQLSNFPMQIKNKNRNVQLRNDRPLFTSFKMEDVQKKVEAANKKIEKLNKQKEEFQKVKEFKMKKLNSTKPKKSKNVTAEVKLNKIKKELNKAKMSHSNNTECVNADHVSFEIITQKMEAYQKLKKTHEPRILSDPVSNNTNSTMTIDKDLPQSRSEILRKSLEEQYNMWKKLYDNSTKVQLSPHVFIQMKMLEKSLRDNKYQPFLKDVDVFSSNEGFFSFLQMSDELFDSINDSSNNDLMLASISENEEKSESNSESEPESSSDDIDSLISNFNNAVKNNTKTLAKADEALTKMTGGNKKAVKKESTVKYEKKLGQKSQPKVEVSSKVSESNKDRQIIIPSPLKPIKIKVEIHKSDPILDQEESNVKDTQSQLNEYKALAKKLEKVKSTVNNVNENKTQPNYTKQKLNITNTTSKINVENKTKKEIKHKAELKPKPKVQEQIKKSNSTEPRLSKNKTAEILIKAVKMSEKTSKNSTTQKTEENHHKNIQAKISDINKELDRYRNMMKSFGGLKDDLSSGNKVDRQQLSKASHLKKKQQLIIISEATPLPDSYMENLNKQIANYHKLKHTLTIMGKTIDIKNDKMNITKSVNKSLKSNTSNVSGKNIEISIHENPYPTNLDFDKKIYQILKLGLKDALTEFHHLDEINSKLSNKGFYGLLSDEGFIRITPKNLAIVIREAYKIDINPEFNITQKFQKLSQFFSKTVINQQNTIIPQNIYEKSEVSLADIKNLIDLIALKNEMNQFDVPAFSETKKIKSLLYHIFKKLPVALIIDTTANINTSENENQFDAESKIKNFNEDDFVITKKNVKSLRDEQMKLGPKIRERMEAQLSPKPGQGRKATARDGTIDTTEIHDTTSWPAQCK